MTENVSVQIDMTNFNEIVSFSQEINNGVCLSYVNAWGVELYKKERD